MADPYCHETQSQSQGLLPAERLRLLLLSQCYRIWARNMGGLAAAQREGTGEKDGGGGGGGGFTALEGKLLEALAGAVSE